MRPRRIRPLTLRPRPVRLLRLPATPLRPFSLDWFVYGLANLALVLGAVGLFWLAFRRLGGLPAEDKARFAGMRIPGIKRLLRYL